MREYRKLYEVFQKYDPSEIVVHFRNGIDYVYQGLTCITFNLLLNEEVYRIQKKGAYRHVYLRKED